MTHVVSVSAIALGVAALVSLSPLSSARADTSQPSGAQPSLSEPAPTPSQPAPTPSGAASAPSGTTAVQHPAQVNVRHYAHHYNRYARHYHTVWRHGHRYVYYRHNPVAAAATGVAGGLADLGSMAAYPFYCFPNYGSCPVYVPYR